ncbi:MAG TPA: zinc ribbon domain-containing protein, partial [Candidatus Binatus sp.]|nr:zinc ribbon domain-containing protein [Candidatus Binatus sp.]
MPLLACQNCGASVEPDQRFCAECGNPLAMGCPSCGTSIKPGQRFCGNCGMRLDGTAPGGPAAGL